MWKRNKNLGDWWSRDDSVDRMITFLHSSICFVVDNILGFDSVTAPYPVKLVFQVSGRQKGRDKKVLEAHWPANLVSRFSYLSESLWQKKTINTDIGSLKLKQIMALLVVSFRSSTFHHIYSSNLFPNLKVEWSEGSKSISSKRFNTHDIFLFKKEKFGVLEVVVSMEWADVCEYKFVATWCLNVIKRESVISW